MIQNITVPARLCTCEALLEDGSKCGYEWISIADGLPECCPNRQCRSREWNGKKKRKIPPKPAVVMPKLVRTRAEEDEEF